MKMICNGNKDSAIDFGGCYYIILIFFFNRDYTDTPLLFQDKNDDFGNRCPWPSWMKKEVEKTKKEMFNKRIFSKYLFSEEHIRSSSRTDDGQSEIT